MSQEIWKPVVGYEGLYEVSNRGNIKSFNYMNFLGERLLSPSTTSYGYKSVFLSKEGKGKNHFVHRIVAQAFIPNPENKPQVNHKNGIRHDYRLDNLEWVTAKENSVHSFKELGRIGGFTGWEGALSPMSKKIVQYDLNMNKIAEFDSAREVTRKLGFPSSNISACARGVYKTSNGFIWKYL